MNTHPSAKELEEKFGYNKINCPVCNKEDTRSKISRHLMNSYNEPKHKEFIESQVEKIKELYNTLPAEKLDPYKLSYRKDIFCSPTYIRRMFREFNDYEEKISIRRSINVKKEFKEGKRTINPSIIGWKPKNRSEYGKRGLLKEKHNKVVELFNSDLKISEISEVINSKQETIRNIWQENFTKEEIEERLIRTSHKYKLTPEQKLEIIKLFYTDLNNKDICKLFNTSNEHIAKLFIKEFGEEEYNIRMERIRKLNILKSLKIVGSAGITGSRPENLCFKLLREKFGDKVIHHDLDTLPPFEIDITIPEYKLAICWDGPFHREPIFGEDRLKNILKRDKNKHTKLLKIAWKIIVIEDNNKKLDKKFVKRKVQTIINLINEGFEGKIIC